MNKTMHAGFLVLYFIALVLSGTSPLFAAGAALVFFLVTSFQVLKMIVVLAVIIGGLCVLFPFLAPVAFILAVVFFVLRIRFIIRNIYAILAGAYMYGLLAAFGASHIGLLGYAAYALAAAAVLVLHVILKWLYRMGYTTKQAFGIMGLVPLLVVAFVLPFLKIPVVHGDVVVSPDVYPDAAPSPDVVHSGVAVRPAAYPGTAASPDVVHDGIIVRPPIYPDTVHSGITVHPGVYPSAGVSYDAVHGAHVNHSSYINPYADEPTVTVRPYIKGDGTVVKGHVRTAPDEVESNNLSYRG
jgi:hypothetical protein